MTTPSSRVIILDDGSEIVVGKLAVGDLAVIARAVRQAVPEGELDALVLQGAALDEEALARAAARLVQRFPELLAPLAACVARRDPAEAARWTPGDCLRLLTASLEANDWPRMAQEMRCFFGAARRTLESVSAGLAGSTRSVSS